MKLFAIEQKLPFFAQVQQLVPDPSNITMEVWENLLGQFPITGKKQSLIDSIQKASTADSYKAIQHWLVKRAVISWLKEENTKEPANLALSIKDQGLGDNGFFLLMAHLEDLFNPTAFKIPEVNLSSTSMDIVEAFTQMEPPWEIVTDSQ